MRPDEAFSACAFYGVATEGVMTPYYQDDACTIYHGDCAFMDEWLQGDVLVTDPPYGVNYHSGHTGVLPRSIIGDDDTSLRDLILDKWGQRPALVFGSWKVEHPDSTRMKLVWDTKGALGMGDLSLPWKPAHQEIYVLGRGFIGRRTSDVLCVAPVQSMAANGRLHPHEKPVELMHELIGKCPSGTVVDPCMGVGSTLVAAKAQGRRCIGVEIDERYCEIAARRLAQEVLAL